MPERINGHVERLHRYLPFSPDHDQIYEEYQRTEDSLNIETRALQYLIRAVEAGARFIVLTGDAGHGKTHLCRRLIERHLGYSEDEARELINTACDGRGTTTARSGRPAVTPLRIYKDFSELTVPLAATQLEEAARREGEVAII